MPSAANTIYTPISLNTWYNLTVIMQVGTCYIYLNGIAVNTWTNASSIGSLTKFTIGGSDGTLEIGRAHV